MKCATLDFHSHILPHMDDGAETCRDSLELLREEWKQGVQDVYLTPHFYPWRESASDFLDRREQAYAELRKEICNRRRYPALHLSAEVAYVPGLSREPLLPMLCCGSSSCILIEPPMQRWESEMFDELRAIRNELGLRPVIAHLDRYLDYLGDASLIRRVRDCGCLIQVNADFFLDSSLQNKAVEMLCCGEIQFVGSDTHNMSSRAPNYSALSAFLKSKKLAQVFSSLNAQSVALLEKTIGVSSENWI